MILEQVDVTVDPERGTGETATLHPDNRISYRGNGVRNILGPYLREGDPREVFRSMIDWSNGYVALRRRGE